GRVLKKLASGDVGVDGIAGGKLHRRDTGVAVVSDSAGGRVERERLGGYGGARKKKGALIGGVGKANQLRLEALDFPGNGLAVCGAESAIGAFRADGDGASEHLNHTTQRGIGDLKPGAQRAEILKKLVVLAGLIVIADESGDSRRIIGELVDTAAGGQLLGGGVFVLLTLLE